MAVSGSSPGMSSSPVAQISKRSSNRSRTAVERLEREAVGHRRLAERRLREHELRDHVCPPPLEPARPEEPLAGRVGIHQRTGTPSAALAQVPLDVRVERRADPAPALLRRDGDPEAALAG